jgi:hypothetical protein
MRTALLSTRPRWRSTYHATDIIFFIEYPFERWDFDRFGIERLQTAGFTVEVWDLTAVVRGSVGRKVTAFDPAEYAGSRQFHTTREVVAAVRAIDRACVVVCLITYTLGSLPVFRALAKAGIPYVVASNNILPRRKASTSRRFFNILRSFQPRRLAEAALMRLPCERLGVRQAALLLAGGVRSCDVRKPVARTSEVAWLHAWDYDAYLKVRSSPSSAGDTVGVFLDEFYPFHPDYALDGTNPPITAEEYYPLIRGFFDYLETRYTLRIAVAAHPRSHYERLPDVYGGRRVIRGRTAEMVRDARFVLAHSSTSINLAVLFRKPIIFLTSQTLRPSVWGESIALSASMLGKTPVDLEIPAAVNFAQELGVDERLYAAYQNDYVKKAGTQDLPFWQQFVEHVRRLSSDSCGARGADGRERAAG